MRFIQEHSLHPLFLTTFLLHLLIEGSTAVQCTSNQISSLNVAGCDCQQHGVPLKCPLYAPQCDSLVAPSTVVRINPNNGGLNLWGDGCIDGNFACNGCYLWFGSLCRCLKPAGTCTLTTPAVAGNPIWALLEDHMLITTTQKLPGILELHLAPEPNRGWQLGQDTLRNPPQGATYTRATGALAMNSVATRTEEQIHIHVCENQSSIVRRELSMLTRSSYTTLTNVPIAGIPANSLKCQVAPFSGMNVNVATAIFDELNGIPNYAASCDKFLVGAGLITDIHDYTWVCVTTSTRAAEELFCHFP